MKKRILSITLAVLMVLALLPFGALAADTEDFSPYTNLIRQLMEEKDEPFYGTFFDFDGDGQSEMIVASPYHGDHGNDTATVYVYGYYIDETVPEDSEHHLICGDLGLAGFRYAPSGEPSFTAAIVETSSGELGLLLHTEGTNTIDDNPRYQGLIDDYGEDSLHVFRNGNLEQIAEADYFIWHTAPDKEGNAYYYPDLSSFSVNHHSKTMEEYNDWIDAFYDSLSVIALLSPYEALDGLNENEMLALSMTGFYDVPADQYYADPVVWALENGITNGTAPYEFSPESPCTRGQVVTFLWRASGTPEPKSASNPFVDVKTDNYFYKAVRWAVEQGITNGMDLTHFGPDVPCTRAHVVTFLWRSHEKPAAGTSNPFSDVPANEYYTDAVLWAVKNEITNGMDATHFGPDSPCIRGQIVTFLYRDLAK